MFFAYITFGQTTMIFLPIRFLLIVDFLSDFIHYQLKIEDLI